MGKKVAVPRGLLWRRSFIHGSLNALARLAQLAADLRAMRAAVEITRDVAYGPHPVAHRLDVYRPRYAPRPLPVLLYIHGGAFVVCSKDTHAAIALLNCAQSEYLVFNINYRLAPNHPFPAAIADACAAYRWVVEHAHEYGGDPRHIVVAGESAGGNLALGVAIAATYQRPEAYARAVYATGMRPQAVMPLMPYLQVSEPLARADCEGAGFLSRSAAQDIARAYLGGRLRANKVNEMADPIRVLEQGVRPDRPFPHVFTGVGTADMCCSDVRRLEAACLRLGIPVSAYYYARELHAFHTLRWRAAARRFWRECIGFLRDLRPQTATRSLGPGRRMRRRSVARVAPGSRCA